MAMGLAGCPSKIECTQLDWQPGRNNCQGTFTGCADDRTRSVVCSPHASTTSCRCRVNGGDRRTFTDDSICGKIGDDRLVGEINRACDWDLAVVAPEP